MEITIDDTTTEWEINNWIDKQNNWIHPSLGLLIIQTDTLLYEY